MFRLVVVVLLGTVVTVNSDKLDVELSINDSGNDKGLTCRARGFNTSDIILNIKKNHCVLTEDDGVKSDGVRTHGNTYWRRDHVTIPQSEVSHYSCEVVHAVSRFRVEKLWDPDSDGRGRIILSEFIATNQPEVELSINDSGNDKALTCRARGFITSDIILNIKKNHYVLTKEDGVKTSGVKPQGNIYWRRDSVIVPQSEVSHYSCEVIHAASRFRVEKVWDPDSDGRGRIISSEFIATNQPEVEMFAENSAVETNIMLTCLVSGFYPNNIILNMKRNGRILTREDGVESSRVCSNEDDTFQRRDSVEIKTSDNSNYSCEVIHDASGSRVEKIWDQSLPHSDGAGHIIHGAVMVVVGLVLVVVASAVLVVLRRRRVRGAVAERDKIKYSASLENGLNFQKGGDVNIPLMVGGGQAADETPEVVVDPQSGTKESKTSVNSNNSSDSGRGGSGGSQSGGSGADSQSGSSTSSTVAASTSPPSGSPDSGNVAEAESLLNGN